MGVATKGSVYGKAVRETERTSCPVSPAACGEMSERKTVRSAERNKGRPQPYLGPGRPLADVQLARVRGQVAGQQPNLVVRVHVGLVLWGGEPTESCVAEPR